MQAGFRIATNCGVFCLYVAFNFENIGKCTFYANVHGVNIEQHLLPYYTF